MHVNRVLVASINKRLRLIVKSVLWLKVTKYTKFKDHELLSQTKSLKVRQVKKIQV